MTRRKLKPHDIILPAEAEESSLVALLGPTNTGKTYHAIERMLSHRSGMIGLPLRLLAREVYDRLVQRRPAGEVALVTGEEKIVPSAPRYWVSTVEAMPLDQRVDFLAVDEIQLAADAERGRIFTSRLLHARGVKETLFLGSDTMRPILRRLFPKISFQTKERFSSLTYAGSKKVTRLPRRTAIVGFSADTVYAIAELVRRQRGGAAVVLGALSPRTRNAQAELYQSGEVDYLVATDAIGMGLNMDIDHVAFAAARKFDGRGFRDLKPAELAQVAGRAGRHIRNGAFGVTADCAPFEEDVVAAIENHTFDPVEALQWRSDALDFSSIAALRASLDQRSPRPDLHRARADDDELALAGLSADEALRERTRGRAATELLWQVCQVPDFRKVSADQHLKLLSEIHAEIEGGGRLPDDWLAARVERLANAEGDFDTISTRIAHIRTWTYLSNRSQWVENAAYWQARTRAIEDELSDALHEKLTQRFVDRRTSVLLKKLRDQAPVLAGVTDDGDVIVEGQFVGRLIGFEFAVDPRARGADAKRMRGAAERALAPILASRAAALANAPESELQLKDDGVIWWRSSPVAELRKGPAMMRPDVVIRGLDAISPNLRGRVADRLGAYVAARIETPLAELIALKRAIDATDESALSGAARGIAFRLVENFGAMSRSQFGDELKQLPPDDRSKLRNLGIRFGEYTLHMPSLLKPAAARLMAMLWALSAGKSLTDLQMPKPGLVSFAVTQEVQHAFLYALGYRPSGDRAVRIDMLERLAQQIRTARNAPEAKEGFTATSQMMSLVGCSGEEFESILRSLGYRKQTIKRQIAPAAPAAPLATAQDAPAPAEPVATEVAEAPAVDLSANEAPAEISSDAVAAEPVAPAAPDAAPAETAAPADAVTEAVVAAPTEFEVTVWRMAPRRPPQPKRPAKREERDAKPAAQPNREARGDRPPRRDRDRDQNRDQTRNQDRSGKKPFRKPADAAPRQFSSAPRRERGPDPNSPFAVLAALKATMGGDSKAE
ncbi:MAG: helicase-related protein [Pseudomonadota bacterium]